MSSHSSDVHIQMDEAHRQLLEINLVALTRDLDPSDIYDELIAGSVLTFDDVERIEKRDTRRDRTMELIRILLRKGPNAFQVLMNSLESNYPHLHDMLKEGLPSTEDILGCMFVLLEFPSTLMYVYILSRYQTEASDPLQR